MPRKLLNGSSVTLAFTCGLYSNAGRRVPKGFGISCSACLGVVTTFPSTGGEHANNEDRCGRNPAKLFGHAEIVTDGVVFCDDTPGNPEPVGLRGSKSPSVRRKRVGHSSVGRVMHDK